METRLTRENPSMLYSEFMHGLIQAGVTLDRKVLADIAVKDAAMFTALAKQAQAAIKQADAKAAKA